MPNIERVTGKIFAENASPVGNNPEIGKFGNAKQGIFTGEANISEIQNSDAWSQGWTSAVVSAMNYPPLPEMNGVLKNLSQQICYLLQKGVPEWDRGTVYYTHNYVNYNGALYYSTIDNNTTEPTTPEAGNNWKSGTVELPIATINSIGAVQPDGVSIGITERGVITVLQSPIIDISHPIGDPILTFNNTLNDNEIWLNGATVKKELYPQLYAVYGNNFYNDQDRYQVNYSTIGNPTINDKFIMSNITTTNYVVLNNPFNPGTNDWEMSFYVIIPATPRYFMPIIGGSDNTNYQGITFGVQSSYKFCIALSSNGTSWDIANFSEGSNQLTPTGRYYIKINYTSSSSGRGTYTVKYSLDNKDWIDDIKIEDKPSIFQSEKNLAVGASIPNNTAFTAQAEIDLKQFVITIQNSSFNNILIPTDLDALDWFRLVNFDEKAIYGTSEELGYIDAGAPNISYIGSPQIGLSGIDGALFESPIYIRGQYLGAGTSGHAGSFSAQLSNNVYGANRNTITTDGVKIRVKTRYQ